MPPLGWYASYDSHPSWLGWRPNLQLDGLCLQLDIWFGTERACLDFIREQILNRPML